MARFSKMHKLQKDHDVIGVVRPMDFKDVKVVTDLLNNYLSSFEIKLKYTEKDVKHFFMPRDKVIYSYVVEEENSKNVVNLISYYSLPSSILKPELGHATVNVAYAYYFIPSKVNSFKALMKYALLQAKD